MRVIVDELVGAEVKLEAGVSMESGESIGVNDVASIGLGVGASRLRGEGVDNGWTVSIKPIVAVTDGTGTAVKPYRLAISLPKIAR